MLPLNFNFAQDVVDRLAGEQRTGLVFVDRYGHRRDYSFAEISDQSQRYAAALRALGVESGERVLLCISNTAKCLFALLAIARLGAVAVPCPEALAAEQIAETARRSAPATVISNRKRRASIEPLQNELPPSTRYILIGDTQDGWARLDTLTAAAKPFRGITTQSLDMAYVLEDQVLDYGSLLEARTVAGAALATRESDRVWSAQPMGTADWLTLVQAPWWGGACTIVHEAPFDARERLDLARELDVTILCQSAGEFTAQLQLPDIDRFRLPRLRRCVVNAPLAADDERRWTERFNVPVYVLRSGFTTSVR